MITTISRRSRFPAPSILSATLSPTGHAIQSQGWGLRNNAYSETSMTDLDTILRGEIAMGNIDIIDFVWRQYGWLADYGWDDAPEEEWWIIAQDNAPDIAADILTHCCAVWSLSRSMAPALSGLWLTSWCGVQRYGTEELFRIMIPRSAIALSDLDRDGILWAFPGSLRSGIRLPSSWHLSRHPLSHSGCLSPHSSTAFSPMLSGDCTESLKKGFDNGR